MYKMRARTRRTESACRRLSCVHPTICENLVTDHEPADRALARRARGERASRTCSWRRACATTSPSGAPSSSRELAAHHTGGQLSVAPEHNNPEVLEAHEKAGHRELRALRRDVLRRQRGGRQRAVPGALLHHAGTRARRWRTRSKLALYLKRNGMRPRQVQDFIPTPMSVATTMYYTGLDPLSQEPVHVARDLREKRMMKALIQYWTRLSTTSRAQALRQARALGSDWARPGMPRSRRMAGRGRAAASATRPPALTRADRGRRRGSRPSTNRRERARPSSRVTSRGTAGPWLPFATHRRYGRATVRGRGRRAARGRPRGSRRRLAARSQGSRADEMRPRRPA